MPRLPEHALKEAGPASDRESDLGSISEPVSESSHEGDVSEDTDTDSEEEALERHQVLTAEVSGYEEILSKGQRRRILAAARQIEEASRNEGLVEQAHAARRQEKVSRPLRGIWKIVEIFTWTCMISQMAADRGWSFLEPVTLESGWDLTLPHVQDQAMDYLEANRPDLVVLAWPCSPWSPLQGLNQKTWTQRRALAAKRRQSRRTFLSFVRRVTHWQRARGGAVIGENPAASQAWLQPEIEQAFEGLPHCVVDQCQYGLRHPVSGMPMRKRTQLVGQELVLRHMNRRCPGDHAHHPIEGTFKGMDGRWRSLSEFAGR